MANRLTVLAVDDTPANLDLLIGMLSDEYKVKIATNGAKALELAAKEPQPDIILLDIMMPEMSGYEVCRLLKTDPATEAIPIIFITAKSEIADEQEGLQLGAVDYVTKPFHPDIVLARVKTHLASHLRTRDLIEKNLELQSNKEPAFSDFSEDDLLKLLASEEGHGLEFKSTLRWNLHADRTDKNIENSCLKTVAGYLNTDGGILMVGVDDSGSPLGLDSDGFKSEDRFLLHWTNLTASHLGGELFRCIRSTPRSVGNVRILVVEVLPSKTPVFFRRDNEESFYVRMENATQSLKPSEVLNYIGQRFTAAPSVEDNQDTQAVSTQNSPSLEKPLAEDLPVKPLSDTSDLHTISGWVHELQHRHVFRTAAIYIVLAWGFTEISTTIAETLEAPAWLERAFVFGFIGGFPIVVLLAWVYDLKVLRANTAPTSTNSSKLWIIGGVTIVAAISMGLYMLFVP